MVGFYFRKIDCLSMLTGERMSPETSKLKTIVMDNLDDFGLLRHQSSLRA